MPVPRKALVTVTLAGFKPAGSCRENVAVVAVLLPMLIKLTLPATTVLTEALTGKPAKLTLMSDSAVTPTLKKALLFERLVSLSAPVVPVPATPLAVCKKVMEALTMAPGPTLANVGVANITEPLAGL